MPSIEVKPTALAWPTTLALTYYPGPQSVRAMVMNYSYAIVHGQRSVGPKIERKQKDSRRDGRGRLHYLPTALMRSVKMHIHCTRTRLLFMLNVLMIANIARHKQIVYYTISSLWTLTLTYEYLPNVSTYTTRVCII